MYHNLHPTCAVYLCNKTRVCGSVEEKSQSLHSPSKAPTGRHFSFELCSTPRLGCGEFRLNSLLPKSHSSRIGQILSCTRAVTGFSPQRVWHVVSNSASVSASATLLCFFGRSVTTAAWSQRILDAEGPQRFSPIILVRDCSKILDKEVFAGGSA